MRPVDCCLGCGEISEFFYCLNCAFNCLDKGLSVVDEVERIIHGTKYVEEKKIRMMFSY